MICVIRVCPHGTIWITELHLKKDEWFGLNVSICKNGETQMRIEIGEARGIQSAEARRGGHQGGGHHGAPVGRGPNFPLGWLNTPWQGTTIPPDAVYNFHPTCLLIATMGCLICICPLFVSCFSKTMRSPGALTRPQPSMTALPGEPGTN